MVVFEAGVAVRDFTPGPGAPLWGYKDRTGVATGTLDPLRVKSCVFRAGDLMTAIVVLDLGRVPLPCMIERLRQYARGLGVEGVLFSAMHTHHAPVMETESAPYLPGIEAAIRDSLYEAVGNLVPARLGVATCEIDIAHNRRVLRDGRCYMFRRNEGKIPTSPVDREATVVAITDGRGNPLASLVHFACHPVVMGPSNMQYSADYVGELTRQVEAATGAPCLFLQGACADINPYLAKTPVEKDGAATTHGVATMQGVATMRAVGAECARQVLASLAGIAPTPPAVPLLAYSEQSVAVGTRWDSEDAASMAVVRAAHGRMFDLYIGNARRDLEVPLSLMVINGELGLAGMPGEVFVHYQLALKQRAPVKYSLLCGYTNGYYGYFPTVGDAAAGGYGGTVASFVGLGAADRLLVEAEIGLATMAGRLNARCRMEDFELVDFRDDSAPPEQGDA